MWQRAMFLCGNTQLKEMMKMWLLVYFSHMGQRGALGQSLRASWQWQRQCQTLERGENMHDGQSYDERKHGSRVVCFGRTQVWTPVILLEQRRSDPITTYCIDWTYRRLMKIKHRLMSMR